MLYFLFYYTQHHLKSGRSSVQAGYFTSLEVLGARLQAWSVQQPGDWKYTLSGENLVANLQAERGVLPVSESGWYGPQGHDWQAPEKRTYA
jgi:hypothetical protein